jgi:hypothetical protein
VNQVATDEILSWEFTTENVVELNEKKNNKRIQNNNLFKQTLFSGSSFNSSAQKQKFLFQILRLPSAKSSALLTTKPIYTI